MESEKNKPKINVMIEKVFSLSLAVLSRCFEHCARVILAPKKTQREVVPSLQQPAGALWTKRGERAISRETRLARVVIFGKG